MDKELAILTAVEDFATPTQRDLAQRTGLSLGTINILVKKMVREGWIKLEKIPANRVAYMLTPKGIGEKKKKTLHYVKYYYQYIDSMKNKMKQAIKDTGAIGMVYIEISDATLRDVVVQVVLEMRLAIACSGDSEENTLIITDQESAKDTSKLWINVSDLY